MAELAEDGSGDAGISGLTAGRFRALAERVRIDGPLEAAQAVEVGSAVLDALEAMHAVGLVHRDVSPGNVIVAFDGDRIVDVRLLDPRLADVVGDVDVDFASPEQLRGESIDERGDLYQLGGVLYFAVTGLRPYESSDRDAVIDAHLFSPPPVPSVHARAIGSGFDRVVVRAMLKAPEVRFADAAEMRVALKSSVTPSVPSRVASVTRESAPSATARRGSEHALGIAYAQPVMATRRDATGWGVGLATAALLAAVAFAVPLLMPPDAATPRPAASTTVAAETPAPRVAGPAPAVHVEPVPTPSPTSSDLIRP